MAQVHPYKFTTAILSFAQQRGLRLIKGKCTSLHTTSVRYTTEAGPAELPADVIIVAAGPWTPSLVKEIEIKAPRAHSVVVKPKALLPAQAVFFSYETQEGSKTQPEVYSRPSEVYISGQMDSRRPLPDLAEDVVASEKEISSLESAAKELSTKLADGVIVTRQACYLPLYDRGFPAVGWHTLPRPKKAGVFVAAGHGVWGISLGPGTGRIVATMVLGGSIKSELGDDFSELAPEYNDTSLSG